MKSVRKGTRDVKSESGVPVFEAVGSRIPKIVGTPGLQCFTHKVENI